MKHHDHEYVVEYYKYIDIPYPQYIFGPDCLHYYPGANYMTIFANSDEELEGIINEIRSEERICKYSYRRIG